MHFILFKPELLLFFYSIVLLLISVHFRKFYRREDISYIIAVANTVVLAEVGILLYAAKQQGNDTIAIFNSALVIDFYTTNIKLFLVCFTLILLVASLKKLLNIYIDTIEYSVILTLSLFFLLLFVSSYSMVTLYLCIEGLSLLSYVLAAFPFNQSSLEAATKYFIIGSFSSGLILFGIICIYGTTGSFDFLHIKVILESQGLIELEGFRWLGLFSLFFGFLFKLGLFPCHMWAVDVYEGT
jgi:NADH-quinone oxidoreductase subunit N